MAIVYQLTVTKLLASNKVRITDSTGSYDADTNTGGYFDPNPIRSSRAVFLYYYTVDANGEQVANTIAGENPITDAQWDIDYTEDFVAAIAMLTIDALSSEPSVGGYELNDYYYNTTSGKIFQNQNGEWTEVTEIDFDNIADADKAEGKVLVLEEVNTYLKNDFIANIDSHTIEITRKDIELLKALKDCANDDFVNKNYLSVQDTLDEINRVITKLT